MDSLKYREIGNRFIFHPVSPIVLGQLNEIRANCGELAESILSNVPEGREQSVALTKLEEVMFWANAGIARARGDALK